MWSRAVEKEKARRWAMREAEEEEADKWAIRELQEARKWERLAEEEDGRKWARELARLAEEEDGKKLARLEEEFSERLKQLKKNYYSKRRVDSCLPGPLPCLSGPASPAQLFILTDHVEEAMIEEEARRAEEEEARKRARREEEARKRARREEEEKARERKARMRMLADGDAVDDVVTVLSSHQIKFLVSGIGDEVPISYLEGKVVGLFFYQLCTPTRAFFELKRMYEKFRERGESFELVFICLLSDCPEEGLESKLLKSCEQAIEKRFTKYFHGNPWLASPFSLRERNKMLYHWAGSLKEVDEHSRFVIIQPGENIAHTCAMDIYEDYGIEAYPFSKSRATEIELARFKSLTLDEVLFSGADEKFVYDQAGRKISASHLVGKNILLFLTRPHTKTSFCVPHKLMYRKVIEWCINRRRYDRGAFEMIRVFFTDKYDRPFERNLEEASKLYYKKMPWLEFPNNKYDMDAVYGKLLKANGDTYHYVPMCVAFGRDGRFISMSSLSIRFDKADNVDYGNPHFFNTRNNYVRVRNYIAGIKNWKMEG